MSEEKPGIVGRYGQVIYWLCCGPAFLIAIYVLLDIFMGQPPYQWGRVTVIIGLAGAIWSATRVVRHFKKGD